MSKKSRPPWAPPIVPKRGPRGAYDPFYVFERAARDNGKPYKSPEPKAELRLLSLLSTKAALTVMSGLLVAVAIMVIVLLVAKG